MAEYIERDACLEKVCEACNMQFGDDAPCEHIECFMREKLMAIPTAEVGPVRHGQWKPHGIKWQCSCCGVLMSIDGTPEENLLLYCPNCGAKMEGSDQC